MVILHSFLQSVFFFFRLPIAYFDVTELEIPRPEIIPQNPPRLIGIGALLARPLRGENA
jgi:hypothetical protein